MKKTLISTAVATAMSATFAVHATAAEYQGYASGGGEYRTGDFHNHTTCSDGSTSVKTLTRKSLSTLDWFIHVGHSGRGHRDCRVDDFLYHAYGGGGRVGIWTNTLEPGEIKGVPTYREMTIKNADGSEMTQTAQYMWRWQSLQEFNLPSIVEERELPGSKGKTAFLGLEFVAPGHEHVSTTISKGQYDEDPNADALAQFEYCFARNSEDDSMGGGQGWYCGLSEGSNEKLKRLFEGRPEEGVADYNSTLAPNTGINLADDGEHVKTAAAVMWMNGIYKDSSFFVPAHAERQGAFVGGANRGWNVEHFRDLNDLAPETAIGFESEPGHQAVGDRGSYSPRRPTAGFYTYGGVGAYSAAEVSMPGLNFDGEPIDPATEPQCQIEGANCEPSGGIERIVLSRPGVRTMWDAMLSEGRKFWFFGSSDWHSRGQFGPLDFESTTDFWPGEFQDNFTYIRDNNPDNPAQDVVDGIKSGNTFVVMGQLIDDMDFRVCSGDYCAGMGETLQVPKGTEVSVELTINDPAGKNSSPYAFNNPALLQMNIEQPMNMPEVAQVDLIQGTVTGKIPSHIEDKDGKRVPNPEYYNPMAPETTHIAASWDKAAMGSEPEKYMSYSYKAMEDGYVRVRGSNLPADTPYARDMDGNPLGDYLRANIKCDDPACPPHVNGVLDNDVEAWADIWFHSNPVFVKVY